MSGYCIQGSYEGVWECLTHEETDIEARTQRAVYDQNEPGISHRIRPESKCPDQ